MGWRRLQRGFLSVAPKQLEKKINFFEMLVPKIFRREEPNRTNLHTDMNLVADNRISETRDFTNQFVLFPTFSGDENRGKRSVSRIPREALEAFSNAECDTPRSAHSFATPPDAPAATPEKGLALGVLKQTARDLRRFRTATAGVKRELYLDAYSWITANDFSWPYSFVNVCKLLHVCPEVICADLLTEASLSWFDYWTRRAARFSGRLRACFVGVFESCRNPQGVESHLAPCI